MIEKLSQKPVSLTALHGSSSPPLAYKLQSEWATDKTIQQRLCWYRQDPASREVWCPQFRLLSRLMWPRMILEVPKLRGWSEHSIHTSRNGSDSHNASVISGFYREIKSCELYWIVFILRLVITKMSGLHSYSCIFSCVYKEGRKPCILISGVPHFLEKCLWYITCAFELKLNI